MGSGGSVLPHGDEQEFRIPIEVKPRGKLGLKSVGSGLGWKPKGGSLRSALSVDLESPEVERIRKDFEMYRLQKENEMANIQKKEQKLEMENKRLRAELQALQKTNSSLRTQRDNAHEAERQALTRAAAFESDRDKVQRQFKLFRETKEKEIQSLLKTKRQVENRLAQVAPHMIQDDMDNVSRESDSERAVSYVNGNPGDWWTALESEPSLDSSMQLHQPMFKGPEFAHTMLQLDDGPFTNVNKDDWTVIAHSLTQGLQSSTEELGGSVVKLYISQSRDMQAEYDCFVKDYLPLIKKMVEHEGRYLVTVLFDNDQELSEKEVARQLKCRCKQIESCTLLVGLLGEQLSSFTEGEIHHGYLDSPGNRPVVFCFKDFDYKSKHASHKAKDLKCRIRDSSNAKIVENYSSPEQGAELLSIEVEKMIKIELGVDLNKCDKSSCDGSDSGFSDLEGPESLCGGCIFDIHGDLEQLEALNYAVKSSCELGFEKYYERLNYHVSAPGPLPPILLSGGAGSGRSLLLAKWLQLQQQKDSSVVVLYHFVGHSHSVSADPVVMMRRLTAQLMQHVSSPPALTSDPVRLVDEFPRWLEKVSSKSTGGVILVLDSIDRFQNAEQNLKWLLDPLPVDSRVVVSVNDVDCPQAWRSWPTVHLEPLSNKHVKELVRAELSSLGHSLAPEHESQIITHCRTPSTCNPLYVMVLSRVIARHTEKGDIDKRLVDALETSDCVELYESVLGSLRHEFETSQRRGMFKKIIHILYACRNGIAEYEMMEVLPDLSWNMWAGLYQAMKDYQIVMFKAGLVVLAHEQVREAVTNAYLTGHHGDELSAMRQNLIQYYVKFLKPGSVTCRVADELPWLMIQMEERTRLKECLTNLCVFQRLYGRGRSAELIHYWQLIGYDKVQMADAYFAKTRVMESKIGQGHFQGIITLPRVADMFETLGRFLRDLGLLTQAAVPLQKSLELRETALDPDHPSVARSYHQLAGLHAQWNKFQSAESLYKQALEIYESAFGAHHHLVAKELDALAVLYHKQDKHESAEKIHRRAMKIRKKSKGPRVPSGTMRSVDPLKRRALRLEELAMGADSPGLAKTLNELGVLYYLQGNQDAAESFFKRSLDMRENVLSADHPDLAQSLNNLAALFNDRKLYDKSQPLYERALQIRRKHFDIEHPSVASIIKHLALLYKKQGKLDQAQVYYCQVVEIREKSFGCQHPSVATALVNLAVLLCQQSKHLEAHPLYERALKIYEESLGPCHPRVAETLRNLAVLKYEQGDYEEAAKLYKRATEIKENEVNKDLSRRSSSADTLSTMKNAMSPQPGFYNTLESS